MEDNLWEKIKQNLRASGDPNSDRFRWIEHVKFLSQSTENGVEKIILSAPSKFVKNWIQDHLLNEINAEFSQYLQVVTNIEVVSLNQTQNGQLSFKEELSQLPPMDSALLNSARIPEPKAKTEFLNANYTFGSFVVGKNNEFAHAASYNVAEQPGGKYNPLFICGPSGMGKTHLLNAVGNEIHRKFPDLRIRYLSAERFVNECVSGIRHKEMEKFRAKYREKCDVLLMDDIQILGQTEAVQEEFFYTLNSLFEKNCQVVVASDRMPKDINGLLDRIRTRLEWGIIADIQMPDVETRVVILKYKAEHLGIHMPEEVINYIAKISKKSIRELEGNLNKVKMYNELQGLPVTLERATEILKTHASDVGSLAMEDIQKIVTTHYNVSMVNLKSATRAKPIVTARQVSMWLCRKYLGKSLQDVGRIHGGKDHTTVMNAIKQINNQLSSNSEIKRDIDELETRIHNLTGL